MEQIEVDLPKASNYNWDTVFYYIVEFTRVQREAITVWGGGYTIKECKETALKNMMLDQSRPQKCGMEALQMAVVDADPDSYFYGRPSSSGNYRKFALFIGEAKVYIYGKRLGFKRLRVGLDPYISRNFVRYMGVRSDKCK